MNLKINSRGIIVVLFILVSWNLLLNGQIDPNFYPWPGRDLLKDAVITESGDFVLAGYSYAPEEGALIRKIDPELGLIWETLVPSISVSKLTIVVIDGSVGILGNRIGADFVRVPFLVVLSSTGLVLEEYEFDPISPSNPIGLSSDFIEDNDLGYFSLGGSMYSCNSMGEIQIVPFFNADGSPATLDVSNLHRYEDGSWLFYQDKSDQVLWKYNAENQLEWIENGFHQLDLFLYDHLFFDSQGQLHVTGTDYYCMCNEAPKVVVSYSPLGEFLSYTEIAVPNGTVANIADFLEYDDGFLVLGNVLRYIDGAAVYIPMIFRLNEEFESDWHFEMPLTTLAFQNSAVKLLSGDSSGDMLLAGFSLVSQEELDLDYFLNEIDIPFDELISSTNDRYDPTSIEIFPNPNNGEFYIASSSIVKEIDVIDLHGKSISVNVELISGGCFVDARNLSSGMLLVRLVTEDDIVHFRKINVN